MIGYFGTKISDHMIQTKQGYLICIDVPIARTGFQEYTPEELEMPGDNLIKVYRDPNQVFDPKTIASFEGNSVTLYHPPQDLDANNDSAYGKGHIQNVRVGTEPDADGNRYLIADLHVKEANLISQIQSGAMREVSCGYSYRLELTDDGNLQQVDIRGNHLAIVPKGRAGKEASIQDHAVEIPRQRKVPMNIFKHILGLGLQQYAKDAEPEKIADAMAECAKDEEVKPDAYKAKDEAPADPFAAIKTSLDALTARMDAKDAAEKAKDEAPKKDDEDGPIADDAALADEDEDESIGDASPEEDKDEEEEKAEDEAIVIPAGDRPENPITGADRKVGDALKLMRKAVAASGDRIAIDAFNSLLPKMSGNTKDGYKQIATRKTGDHAVTDERAAAADFAAKAKAMHRKQTTK